MAHLIVNEMSVAADLRCLLGRSFDFVEHVMFSPLVSVIMKAWKCYSPGVLSDYNEQKPVVNLR